MISHRSRLKKDIARWIDTGLIDQQTGTRLADDLDARHGTFQLGNILALLAALLCGASVILLVAANWEAIPRPVRAGGLVALLWCGYGLSAFYRSRGRTGVSEALLAFSIAVFGASIALVGQMYHLSGDAAQVALLWFGGCLVSAALFRSPTLAQGTAFLAWFYLGSASSSYGLESWTSDIVVLPILAALSLAVIEFCGAKRARHLVFLLLVAWLVRIHIVFDGWWVAAVFAAAGAAAFFAQAALPAPAWMARADEHDDGPFYALLVALLFLAILHGHAVDDGALAAIAVGLAILGLAVGALILCGRTHSRIRYLGYAAFALEILYLGFETIGTMIGTAGFFAGCGLLVAMLAFLAYRMERRFTTPAEEQIP